MDFEQYEKAFQKVASNSGYSEENIKKCLDYAIVLFINKVPVIYNTSHLSALVGYKKEYIKQAVFYTPKFYRDFLIKKKNGTFRSISEPLPSLKEIQTWILNNILEKISISPFAKAYVKKVSLNENLRFHKNQEMVLTIDLKDFFSSIKIHEVEKIFKSVGYSALVSNLLAKLCTKDDCLPQGAPTSPLLSNIFFNPIDDIIASYCLPADIRYTRYADDLSFSGVFDKNELIEVVKKALKSINLKINSDKVKLMLPNARQIVTGIVVNKKPQVVFYKRNKLRQEIFYIKKFGFWSHVQRREIKQRNYFEHILGQINFILQINPNDNEFQEYKSYLIKLRREGL